MLVMADDVVTALAAAPGVVFGAKWLFDRFVSKADKSAEKEAAQVESKLDQLVDGQRRMELDLRGITEKMASQAGIVEAVDRRVQGLSSDYGQRIKALELDFARLAERLPKGKR